MTLIVNFYLLIREQCVKININLSASTQVSDYNMAVNLKADVINGPTLGTGLAPFQWTDAYPQSHVGLPDVYNFPFITTQPLPSP